MSFLLMNLFTPTPTATAGTPAAVKADAQGNGAASGNGAAFSAMLASAKDRLASAKSASAANLSAQPLDAAALQAIKQPNDLASALKDLALTEQQLTDLRDSLRDALDTEHFAGDEQTEQAFQELHDQLDVDTGGDVVDIDAVVVQLPVVKQASTQTRGELLTRIAQFIQTSLNGQGAGTHGKSEQPNQAQLHQAPRRTDPLLEVVQASMFPAQAHPATPTQAIGENHAEALTINPAPQAGVNDASDDLPRWVRDIAPAKAAAVDEGDIYRDLPLPEVNLPGSDDTDADADVSSNGSQGQIALPAAVAAVVVAPTQIVQATPAPNAEEASVQPAAIQGLTHADTQQAIDAPDNVDMKLADRDASEPVASDKTDSANARGEAGSASAVKPAKHASAHGDAGLKLMPQTAAREALAPLPEKNTGDITLDVVRTDPSTAMHAPTHQEKIAATTVQRVANSALYQHRAEVVEQVHVAITRASKAEIDRITIQLDPADLGRVDVMMDVRRDGTTHLIVAADRRETLDMLQRDARGLERALQEAGVKADAGSMEFNMRQQQNAAAFGGQEQGFSQNRDGQAGSANARGGQMDDSQHVTQPQIISSATYTVSGGLNVIV